MRVNRKIWLFLIPALAIYGFFYLYPTVLSLFYSLTDWDGISPTYEFVGIKNFINLWTKDTIFVKSLTNNIKFSLSATILQFVVSLFLAILLVKNTKTNVFLRALYFFPAILASVSVGFIWSFLYAPQSGPIDQVLKSVGLGWLIRDWLGDQSFAIYSIAIVKAWFHVGQMIVIFVAGLQAIPSQFFEVAKIEGASRLQTFKQVTWPLIAPASTIVVAYTTIQTFKAFDLIYTMTRGGPNYATEIIATNIYNVAFRSYKFGYAAAQSIMFLVIIGAITFMQFRIVNRYDVQ
ncbi:sugar ABC transporter permease [Vallitalea pronyensis]|uniref:Sugar ABC transporter permease n=1 Tax=Vallitalea pronyensis TaxID=1348613 RepID=A0A8J8MLF8_9FIRM|nr:sugar ABC transporter permease [Vallitalea pronyensis]QUI23676.1 sugar ABC transporter permease [Vallitalea pronyensis]